MMFLDELLEFLKGKEGLYVEFEMKTKPEALYPEERLHAYCDKLYDAVMAVKPADATFVFTSGDYRGLRYLQAKHPGVDLLLITSKPLQRRDDRPLQGHGHQAHGCHDGRHEPQGGEEGAQGGG